MFRPIIQKLSGWQKENCLFCDNKATNEAYFEIGNATAHIRCCEDRNCQSLALERAEQSLLTGTPQTEMGSC